MELEGNLSVFSLPEILQFLAQGRMTGILTLVHGSTTTKLEIREGKIANSSTMDRPLRLGEMLVHRNLIPRRALDEALATQKNASHGRMLGELLVERHAITREELQSAIRLQMEEELWEMSAWKEGTFKFEKGGVGERAVETEIDVESFLQEGSRRQDEWKHISKAVADEDAIFAVVPPEKGEESSFPLKEREWIVLSLVNGFYTASSIISRTGYGSFETYQILNRLLMSGLIQKINSPPVRLSRGSLIESRPIVDPEPSPSVQPQNGQAISSGLLGRLRKKNTVEMPIEPTLRRKTITASTPIGCIVAYLNELISSLSPNVDLSGLENGEPVLNAMWRQVLNICPRADLLFFSENRFSSERFEHFVSAGAAERMQTCYDETVEALGRFLGRLFLMASNRMGERNANRAFHSVCESIQRPSAMAFEPDFVLEAFVSKAID